MSILKDHRRYSDEKERDVWAQEFKREYRRQEAQDKEQEADDGRKRRLY